MAEAAIIISCLVVFALCRPITILGGMEAESARMCFEMTLFITITKPISWVLSFIPAYGMRAAGDVKFSMITSCASMWLCRVSFTIYSYAVYMALVLLLYGLECLPTGLCAVSCSLYVSTPADGLIII